MTLSVGDYALLFPEDVGGQVPEPFYASVVALSGATATLRPLEAPSRPTYAVDRGAVAKRVVPPSDATGARLGRWSRKAVCFSYRAHHYYGQVVGYSGRHLRVATRTMERKVDEQHLIGEVYPVVAMALGTTRWAKRTWSASRLEELHESLLGKLLEGRNGRGLNATEWLEDLREDLGDLSDLRSEWVDPASGETKSVSLSYVMQHVFYVDRGASLPAGGAVRLGDSFCDEPERDEGSTGQEFFDPLVDDDLSDGVSDAERTRVVPPESTTRASKRIPSATSRHPAPPPRLPTGVVEPPRRLREHNNDSDEIELIELIRKHRPHLLSYYLTRTSEPGVQGKRVRQDVDLAEDAPPVAKRTRGAFTPTTEQERIHMAITAPTHYGKSGDSFLEAVMSSEAVQFVWHPGVLARLYDIQFGTRGLSIMHFRPVSILERLKMMSPGSINTSDYNVAAPVITPPASWSQLSAATRCFLRYCQSMCDTVTIEVATALDSFVTSLEGWNQLLESDLQILVLWLDATLEKYRGSVVWDVNNNDSSRLKAAGWFSIANPEVNSLVIAAMGERLKLARSGREAPYESRPRVTSVAPERKIPADVIDRIPTRDGKEVCLQYLSRRGCPSRDPTVCTFKQRAHFWPDVIPQEVRRYLNSKLGGVRQRPTNA